MGKNGNGWKSGNRLSKHLKLQDTKSIVGVSQNINLILNVTKTDVN